MIKENLTTSFLVTKIKDLLNKSVLDSHPKALLPKFLEKNENHIIINGKIYDMKDYDIYVIGYGKAGSTMAEMIEKIIGEDDIKGGLVVSPDVNPNVKSIEIIESSHPFVSDLSFRAGEKMIKFVENIPDNSIAYGSPLIINDAK